MNLFKGIERFSELLEANINWQPIENGLEAEVEPGFKVEIIFPASELDAGDEFDNQYFWKIDITEKLTDTPDIWETGFAKTLEKAKQDVEQVVYKFTSSNDFDQALDKKYDDLGPIEEDEKLPENLYDDVSELIERFKEKYTLDKNDAYDVSDQIQNFYLDDLLDSMGYVDQLGRTTLLNDEELNKLVELWKLVERANKYWSGKGQFNDYILINEKGYTKQSLQKYIDNEIDSLRTELLKRHKINFNKNN